MMDINTAWSDFCDGTYDIAPTNTDNDVTQTAPKSSDLYISEVKLSPPHDAIIIEAAIQVVKIVFIF